MSAVSVSRHAISLAAVMVIRSVPADLLEYLGEESWMLIYHMAGNVLLDYLRCIQTGWIFLEVKGSTFRPFSDMARYCHCCTRFSWCYVS